MLLTRIPIVTTKMNLFQIAYSTMSYISHCYTIKMCTMYMYVFLVLFNAIMLWMNEWMNAGTLHHPTAMTQPPPSLSLSSFLPLPFPFPFSLPLFPVEVGPVKSSQGVWKSAATSPIGIWRILALNMTCGANKLNYFPENRLNKFKLCPPTSLFLLPEDFCDAFCVAGVPLDARPWMNGVKWYFRCMTFVYNLILTRS